jgi:AAA domain
MAKILAWRHPLPEALYAWRSQHRWVIYRNVLKSGKVTKPPFQSLRPQSLASVTDPDTWSDYSDAVTYSPPMGEGGIGFVLGSKWGGMDLDNCFKEGTRTPKPWAKKILDLAEGHYIDESPGGNGLHILGYVNGGKTTTTRIDFGDGHVEVYRKSPRYFTVTGKQHGECKEMGNIDAVIDAVLEMKPSVSLKGVKKEADTTRSTQLYRQIRDLLKIRKDDDEIFRRLEDDWTDYKGVKHLKAEIVRIRGKYEDEKGVVEEDDENECRFKSESEFLEGFVPPNYLIKNVVHRRFIYALTAKTGSGKTAVTLCLALMVGRRDRRNQKLVDHKIKNGRVIYLAGENPDDIRIRWMAQLEREGLEIGEVDVHFLDGTTDITKNIEMLKEAAARLDPILIIVDTARAYFRGDDENSNTQMGAYARTLRQFTETGACVIVNCHPTKNALLDNLQPVGGGAFVAEIDGNLTCIRDDDMVHLHWQTKLRGPEFAPIQFELKEWSSPLKDEDGDKIKSVIAAPMNEAKVEARTSRSRIDKVAVLEIMANGDSMSLNAMADRLEWKLANGRPNRSKAQRVIGSLEKQKLVSQPMERSHYAITKAGRVWLNRMRRRTQRVAED